MIRVRRAAQEDLPHILEIARHSPLAAGWSQAEYGKLFSAEKPVEALALVIEEDGQVLGFLAGRRVAKDEWELENVAVSSSSRRRGMGAHLVGEFLNVARHCGGRDVFLEVRESNRAARLLYEKWAFVEVGRRKDYYRDPPEDALILRFSFEQ